MLRTASKRNEWCDRIEHSQCTCEPKTERELFHVGENGIQPTKEKNCATLCVHCSTTTILADSIFDKRAEQLSVEDFANLTFKMKEV
jgi:hypothetical protein